VVVRDESLSALGAASVAAVVPVAPSL